MHKTLESRRQAYSLIRTSLFAAFKRHRPFSLLRIGDGKSVILAHNSSSPQIDLEAHLNLWFGKCLPSANQLLRLQQRLKLACRTSTILGIPTLRQCGLNPRYLTSYNSLVSLLSGRRRVLLTDAAIHRFLHLSGDLLALLRGSPYLGVVTSKPIANEVLRFFRPSQLFVQTVPPESPLLHQEITEHSRSWYDHSGKPLMISIKPPYRGAPYLVGAGLMGKLICDQIRSAGGFAIDIGSLCDGWSSVPSRSYFDNYPPGFYSLEHAYKLSLLSDQTRMEKFLSYIQLYEAAPKSFCLS